MIFVDPSELRETSKLKGYITVYTPLPDLEARTGADIMVSPSGLPFPANDALLQVHINQGAKLINAKFGHDLTSSVVDGRLVEQLSRMLKCRAQSWQCLLLPIGTYGYDDTQEMALINGQLSYGEVPMTWKSLQAAMIFWIERGGSIDFPLPKGELIPEYLAIHQGHLDRFRGGDDVRTLWPEKPAFYEELGDETTLLNKWRPAQKVERIEDIRVLLCAIPDARIGPEKATAIFNFMAENGIRQDFSGLLKIIDSKNPLILQVPGIGKKTFEAILWGLWRTKEERDKKEA